MSSTGSGLGCGSYAGIASTASMSTMDPRFDAKYPCEAGTGWSWQRELEGLRSRWTQSQTEEVTAARRSAEELERLAIRQIEEVERRVLRCHAEEGEALQRFLSGWNNAMEARFLRQSAQIESMERRIGEEADRSERARAEARLVTEEAHRIQGASQETLDSLERQIQVAMQAAIDKSIVAIEQIAQALREELEQQRSQQEQETSALAGALEDCLQTRLGDIEATGNATADALAELEAASSATARALGELQPFVERVAGQVQELEGSINPRLEGLQQSFDCREAALRQSSMEAAAALRGEVEALGARHVSEAELACESREHIETELRAAAEAARAAMERALCVERETANHVADIEAHMEQCTERLAEQTSLASNQFGERLQFSEQRCKEMLQHAEVAATQEVAATCAELRNMIRGEPLDGSEAAAERNIRRHATSYDWRMPRCLHRLRYLSLATEAGVSIDSEIFSLAGMEPLTLRLFPHGLSGGDGQCAVALRLPKEPAAAASNAPLPSHMDIVIGESLFRAEQREEPLGGGVQWVAEGLGSVQDHVEGVGGEAELHIRVEVSSASAKSGGVQSAAPTGVGRGPSPLRSSLADSVQSLRAGISAEPTDSLRSSILARLRGTVNGNQSLGSGSLRAVQQGTSPRRANPFDMEGTANAVPSRVEMSNPFANDIMQLSASTGSLVAAGATLTLEGVSAAARPRPLLQVGAPGKANPV